MQDAREAKEREAKEREAKKAELRESKKHKENKEKESGTEKVGKKQPLPSTSQSSSSQAQENVSPTTHLPHTSSSSSVATSSTLHATPSISTPGTPLETINIGNSHGRQLSPIQSASVATRTSPTRHSPPSELHSMQQTSSVSTVITSKNAGSHAMTLSKTNIGLAVVGSPSHESTQHGPPAFR